MESDPVHETVDISHIAPDQTLVLDKPPCCIEFWPVDPEYFVIGTYNLVSADSDGATDSSTQISSPQDSSRQSMDTAPSAFASSEGSHKGPHEQRRDGSLILLRLNGNTMQEIETTKTASAVLDIRFSPHDPSVLAAATSNGTVILYSLEVHAGPSPRAGTHLSHPVVLSLFDDDTIVTSVAWDPEDENRLAVTTSTGEAVLVSLSPLFYDLQSGRKELLYDEIPSTKLPHQELDLQVVHRHELEAWIISWNPSIKSIRTAGPGVLSGGDDGVLRYSPIEPLMSTLSGAGKSKTAFPTGTGMITPWFDRRMHGAGVTAILPLTVRVPISRRDNYAAAGEDSQMATIPEEGEEEILTVLVTGCYDDHLRVLSCPSHTKRVELADAAVSQPTMTNFSRPGAGNGNGSGPSSKKSVSFAAGAGATGTEKPKLLHELAMPGGVWRIKLLSTKIDIQHHEHDQRPYDGLVDGPPQPLNNNPVHPALRPVSPIEPTMTVTIKIILAIACMYSGAYVVEIQLKTLFYSSPAPSSLPLTQGNTSGRKDLDQSAGKYSINPVLESISPQLKTVHSGQSTPYSRREEQWGSRIVAMMGEHKSICYGIDAQPLPDLGMPSLAAMDINSSTSHPVSPASQSARRSTSSLPSPPFTIDSTPPLPISARTTIPASAPSPSTSNRSGTITAGEDREVTPPARIAAATAATNMQHTSTAAGNEAQPKSYRLSTSSSRPSGEGEDFSVSSVESSRYTTAYNSIRNSSRNSLSGSDSNSESENERVVRVTKNRTSPLRNVIGGALAAERAAQLAAGVQAHHSATDPYTTTTTFSSSPPTNRTGATASTAEPPLASDSKPTRKLVKQKPKHKRKESGSRFSRLFSSSSSDPSSSKGQSKLEAHEHLRTQGETSLPLLEPYPSPRGELAPIPISTEPDALSRYPPLTRKPLPSSAGRIQPDSSYQLPHDYYHHDQKQHYQQQQQQQYPFPHQQTMSPPMAMTGMTANAIKRKRLKRRILTCSFYDRRVCLWRF